VTEVHFYVLKGDSNEARLVLACRLADKAVQRDQHVLIRPESPAEARRLDDLLWTFSQGSFLPHRLVTGAGEKAIEPVLIDDGPGPAGERWDLLINLSGEVPDYFSRYARVAEVVDAEAERRARGRDRYRYYRDRGYPLKTHEV